MFGWHVQLHWFGACVGAWVGTGSSFWWWLVVTPLMFRCPLCRLMEWNLQCWIFHEEFPTPWWYLLQYVALMVRLRCSWHHNDNLLKYTGCLVLRCMGTCQWDPLMPVLFCGRRWVHREHGGFSHLVDQMKGSSQCRHFHTWQRRVDWLLVEVVKE